MLELHELQQRFAAAVLSGGGRDLAQSITDDAPGATARLGIYVNHFRVTLIDALAATYPVVQELVGAPFFQTAARRYVQMTPPVSPCLFEYGGGFPGFLERLPEARSLTYLADVARLEWAVNEAWHAPDAPALAEDAAARLAVGGFSDLAVRLHPSCRLIASPFPVHRIWQIHQKACTESEPIDLQAGGIRLLVHRREDNVGWIELSAADFAFLERLIISRSLERALKLARIVDHRFDPMALLAALMEGAIVSLISRVP